MVVVKTVYRESCKQHLPTIFNSMMKSNHGCLPDGTDHVGEGVVVSDATHRQWGGVRVAGIEGLPLLEIWYLFP